MPGGLDPKEHKELFKATLSALEGRTQGNSFFRQVKGQYDRANKARTIDMTQKPKRGTKNGKYAAGDMAPDIVMNDPSGVERKLSDLRGKVVLVDFGRLGAGLAGAKTPTWCARTPSTKTKDLRFLGLPGQQSRPLGQRD